MNKELEELKSVLRSLVVSSPTQVDVRSLLRDYRNMMGAPVPLTKYGYRDPVLFLRERFSDCFVFHGAQNNPILTLIVPDALRHIDEFVQRQKLSSTVKFKGKRTSIPEQVIRQPKQNLIASTYVPNKTNNNSKYNPSPRATPKTTAPHTIQKKAEPHKITNININSLPEREPLTKSMNKLNIQDKTISKESIVNNKENKHENCNNVDSSQDKNCSQSALQNFLKKRLPVYNSSQHIEKYDIDIASSKDDDSGRQTSSTTSSTKAALLEELKMEIRDLVAEHPEGVWCTDLIGLYRERYKRELNFSRFGYTSIISLVCVLEDVVHIQRSDDGKWLLRDARAAAAAEAARPRRYLPVSVARLAHAHHDRVDPDDALPGIDFDPDVFPTDCMHFMESIPAASLAELETGAMLEVILGEVYSPSHFWLLRLGERHHLAMEDMMDDMTKYYTYGEGKDRVLALGAVRVGHYCSSVFEGDWHRSLIVRIQDCDTVKVRHIDYGTVESVSVGALKPLRREWAALPAQAVRARLAGVRPPAAGRRWPHAASAHFLQLVRDTRLVANIVAVDREQDILEVFLIDTSTEDDVCISAQMVRSGHADARPDSALRVSDPAAPAPPPPAGAVRGLLAALQHMNDDDSASDVSASASEVVGRAPRRLSEWDAERSHPVSPAVVSDPADGSEVSAEFNGSEVSARLDSEDENLSVVTRGSLKLARLRARLNRATPPGAPEPKSDDDSSSVASQGSIRLARLRALHSPLRVIPEHAAVVTSSSPTFTATAAPESVLSSSSDSPASSVVSVSSRLLQKRLALAKKLNSMSLSQTEE